MILDRGRVQRLVDGQKVRQDSNRQSIEDQRGPPRFHEEQLGRSGLGEERGQWPERGRRAGLTPTVVETRTGEDYRTKEGAYGAGRLFLDLKGRAQAGHWVRAAR